MAKANDTMVASPETRRDASHHVASHRIASHCIVSHRIASYRIVSYSLSSTPVASYAVTNRLCDSQVNGPISSCSEKSARGSCSGRWSGAWSPAFDHHAGNSRWEQRPKAKQKYKNLCGTMGWGLLLLFCGRYVLPQA
jgi:hypothetical protein